MSRPRTRTRFHTPDKCAGQACCIHNPSDHHMREWPLNWRSDTGVMERICPCGVGHPDPDYIAYVERDMAEESWQRVHGCCGCCSPLNSAVDANPEPPEEA